MGDHGRSPPPSGARRRVGARVVAEQIARLADACVAIGRDPRSVDRLVLTGTLLDPGLDSESSFADACARYGEAGVTDLVVPWPRPEPPFQGDVAMFERIFGDGGRYARNP